MCYCCAVWEVHFYHLLPLLSIDHVSCLQYISHHTAAVFAELLQTVTDTSSYDALVKIIVITKSQHTEETMDNYNFHEKQEQNFLNKLLSKK